MYITINKGDESETNGALCNHNTQHETFNTRNKNPFYPFMSMIHHYPSNQGFRYRQEAYVT